MSAERGARTASDDPGAWSASDDPGARTTSDPTQDAFLGGRVQAWQPAHGFRAGVDTVVLAAACPAQARERVLELGCGVGVAALCLRERTGAQVTGVERNLDYVALARRNGVDVVAGDVAALPADLKIAFDHVIANPPFFGPGTAATDDGREAALREDTPLAVWCATARARLKPKGWFTLIHMAERLPDVLAALDGFGSITVQPLAARLGRNAARVVVRARKGGRGAFILNAPILVHEGATHTTDGEDFSATLRAVLRDGAALPFAESAEY